MKTLPAFPYIISYAGVPYAAVSVNSNNDKLTLVVLATSGMGQIYHENITQKTLLRDLANGTAKLVGSYASKETSLKIEVDSTLLDKSLATAKELEATLKRIAGALK